MVELEETLYRNSHRKVECEESSEKPLSKLVSKFGKSIKRQKSKQNIELPLLSVMTASPRTCITTDTHLLHKFLASEQMYIVIFLFL